MWWPEINRVPRVHKTGVQEILGTQIFSALFLPFSKSQVCKECPPAPPYQAPH